MFDRSAFKIKTFEEADNNREYWMRKTPMERLSAAWILTCAAYNIDPYENNKMDKTHFEMRKRDE